MQNRIAGYDLIRSFSFFIIFIYHIVNRQVMDSVVLLTVKTTATISVCLLGFISSVLLSNKEIAQGVFLIRRLTRIYIPLILCLTTILGLHALNGKTAVGQHTLLHLLGLTAFIKLVGAQDNATIGHGLWFVTTIIGLYFVLPVLQLFFKKPNGLLHLLAVSAACTALNYALAGSEAIFALVITFSIGVYLSVNQRVDALLRMGFGLNIVLAVASFTFSLGMIKIYDAWHPLSQLVFCLSPLAFFPLFFNATSKLPPFFLNICVFFAALSYEFYILHFYFINEGFREFFNVEVGLFAHIAIAFAVVLSLSYVISRISSFLSAKVNGYLCGSVNDPEKKIAGEKSYKPASSVVKP